MTSQNFSSLIKIIPARVVNDRIKADLSDQDLWREIEQPRLVILRGVFGACDLLQLRRDMVTWGEQTLPFPVGKSASLPFLNFHRRDDGVQPSVLPHIFQIYSFGDYQHLPPIFGPLLQQISELLLDLQNRVADTDFHLDNGEFKTLIVRNPRGGGYLVGHRHKYLPRKVSIFVNMSEPGVDYLSDTAWFNLYGQKHFVRDQFLMGDLLLWRYDLMHGVDEVDGDFPLSWGGDDGFWLLALEEVEAQKYSRQV